MSQRIGAKGSRRGLSVTLQFCPSHSLKQPGTSYMLRSPLRRLLVVASLMTTLLLVDAAITPITCGNDVLVNNFNSSTHNATTGRLQLLQLHEQIPAREQCPDGNAKLGREVLWGQSGRYMISVIEVAGQGGKLACGRDPACFLTAGHHWEVEGQLKELLVKEGVLLLPPEKSI
ncbi:hypothetical protein DFJ77DRAFT_257933 [Powellomyces hirtus]|nr:hypothetical protein DFJ77DRAFT_257933 [Powellomyces hirtus]